MTTEPKKSARLAEKRKLREEAGTPVSEDDYYFTPLFSTKASTTKHRSCSPSNSRGTPSPLLPPTSVSPTLKKSKAKVSPTPTAVPWTPSKSPLLVSPPKIPNLLGAGADDHVERKANSKPEIQPPTSGGFTTARPGLVSSFAKVDQFAGLAMLGNADEMLVCIMDEDIKGIEDLHTQKQRKAAATAKANTADVEPRRVFLSNKSGNYITYPKEVDLDLTQRTFNSRTETSRKCGAAGCRNPRKYVCSKTKVPLCSLECFKKNLETNANACHAEGQQIAV